MIHAESQLIPLTLTKKDHPEEFLSNVGLVQTQMDPVQAQQFSERALVNSVRALMDSVRAPADLRRAPLSVVPALVDTEQIQWAALWILRDLLRIHRGL